MERGQAQAPIPPGHFHNPRGRAMALDATRVRSLLHPLLAPLRAHLVADHLHPRRSQPSREPFRAVRPLPQQRQLLHRVLPLLS